MPRFPRQFIAGEIYHITVRGNNRQTIFGSDADRHEYLQLLFEITQQYLTEVHAFVLMPNHTHLLLRPIHENSLSRTMQLLNAVYTKYINRRYERVGHLFQGRFHSSHVSRDSYLVAVSRYIHMNPVKAGLAVEATQFAWSSAKAFTGSLSSRYSLDRLIKRLVNPSFILNLMSTDPQQQRLLYRQLLRSVSDTEHETVHNLPIGV